MSYLCSVDYTNSLKDVNFLDGKKIKIRTKIATINFSISSDAKNTELIEDDRYVLLVYGDVDESFAKELLSLLYKHSLDELLCISTRHFTLTLYDKEESLFISSRDIFSLYPLYYYQSDTYLLFSNSLKTFKNNPNFEKKIDLDTLGQYLQHGYIFQPFTMFEDCYKVASGCMVSFDIKSRKVTKSNYWDISTFYDKPRVSLTEQEIVDKCETLLSDAITKEIGSSKKVGTFLSGGYDSSAILSLLAKDKTIDLHTYTIGFKEKDSDEAPYAKEIAEYLQTTHHEHYFDVSDLRELLTQVPLVYDEPLADKAILPTMLIAKLASADVDILFGGEGGDEVFASSGFLDKFKLLDTIPYPLKYTFAKILRLFSKTPRCVKWANMLQEKDIEKVINCKDVTMSFCDVEKFLKQPVKKRHMEIQTSENFTHYLDKIFPNILKNYVSDNLLTKLSYATSEENIKAHVPFLDKNVVEFLATVDVNQKRKDDQNKYILKKILDKYLPRKLFERPKKGFEVPVQMMLKDELRDMLDTYINSERIEKEGIFEVDEIMKLKERFLTSSSPYDVQNIWNILIFELWYEEWFSR